MRKARRPLAYENTCPRCGRWKHQALKFCRSCGMKEPNIRDMQFSRDPLPRRHPEQSEEEQDRILRELSRCEYCGLSGGHTSNCYGYAAFVDIAEEYDPHQGEEAL